jgi:hypothetical protein
MVKKAFLPMRFVISKLKQFLADGVAQRLNPTGKVMPVARKAAKRCT